MEILKILGIAKDAVKGMQLSEVMRERQSLALDQLTQAEKQVALLQTKVNDLEVELKHERINHQHTKEKLATIEKKWSEDVRIFSGVEWRCGLITSRVWLPFCPKCHIPAVEQIHQFTGKMRLYCNARSKCGWIGVELEKPVSEIVAGLV